MNFALLLGFSNFHDFKSIAQAAEQSGWRSVAMPDSLFYPKATESEYPYNNTETIREFIETTPFLEPCIAMATMAAVTSRIRFYPSVMKVPVRQPLLLAKLLTSLAAVSNNRVVLGAGLSPWREDFAYNGLDFQHRGRMMDQCIEIIRAAMSGEFFEHHGPDYDFGPLKMNPVPDRPVPIFIGGHATPALKRAARIGDGWVSANSDLASLKKMIEELNRYRAEYGTLQRTDFEIHGSIFDSTQVDDFKRMEDIGVTEVAHIPWGAYSDIRDTQTQIDAIKRFGDEIISKFQ